MNKIKYGLASCVSVSLVLSPIAAVKAQDAGGGEETFSDIGRDIVDEMTSDPDSVIERVEGVFDISECWTGPAPAVLTAIDYQNTCHFDKRVNVAMGADISEITVNVSGRFSPLNMPERMSQWIRAVDRRGEVKYCRVQDNTAGIFSILSILFAIFRAWKRYDTYSPARNYNAVVVYSESGSATDSIQSVEQVVFQHNGRGSPSSLALNSCPEGTTEIVPT